VRKDCRHGFTAGAERASAAPATGDGGVIKTENINHEFLDPVVAGREVDVYHHFGVSSDDPILERLRGVRAVIMAGSGERIRDLASRWSEISGDPDIIAFPKEDRFVARYTGDVLFHSHGMGMPSASIAVQEAMKMTYFLKRGDLAALDDIFWARVGTCGGVGLPGGTLVVSNRAVMPDLKPFRLRQGAKGTYWFEDSFPDSVRADIVAASEELGVPIVEGTTMSNDEFFVEQFRLDGAIRLEDAETKQEFLEWLREHGVCNIEMEGAMLAGYLNQWGFPDFAMVCTVLLDRIHGDQVLATEDELATYTENAGLVVLRYLQHRLGVPGDR